jgi:hypothetical protein
MNIRSIACCLLLFAVAACAEEKKQRLWRHDDDFERQTSASGSSSASALERASPPGRSASAPRSPGRRIDPEIGKRYLVEACLASAKIMEVARDDYLDSLKNTAPSTRASSTFVTGFPSPASCRIASGANSAKVGTIDVELRVVSASANTLWDALYDAKKYYRDGAQKNDGFAEDRALHKKVIDLAGVRDDREALMRSFDTWLDTLPPPDTATWTAARFAGRDFMATARTVSRLLQATPIAMHSVENGALALEAQLKLLNGTDSGRSDQLFRNSAERFSRAVSTLAKTKGPARPELIRALSEYIHVVDAARRAFEGELSPTPRLAPGHPPLPPRAPP